MNEMKLAKCCGTCLHANFPPRRQSEVCRLVSNEDRSINKSHKFYRDWLNRNVDAVITKMTTCNDWVVSPVRGTWAKDLIQIKKGEK